MIVLDTNVVSEVVRAQPDRSVVSWFSSQPPSAMFTTAITQAELLFGLELLPGGKRRQRLTEAVQAILDERGSPVASVRGMSAVRHDRRYRLGQGRGDRHNLTACRPDRCGSR